MKHFLIAYLDNYHAKMSIKCIKIVKIDYFDKEMWISNGINTSLFKHALTNKLI